VTRTTVMPKMAVMQVMVAVCAKTDVWELFVMR